MPARIRRFSIGLALLLASLTSPAKADDKDPDDDLPGLGEVLAGQAYELGNAIDQRNRLKAEREQTIRDLEARLAACKSCGDKAQIEAELARWRRTDGIVREAERGALASMGLPQYGSLDELGVGMLQSMAQAGNQIEAQRRRQAEVDQLRHMVRHACEAEHQPKRPAHCKNAMPTAVRQAFNQKVQACVQENDPLRLYAKDLMVRDMCKRHGDPETCTRANSPLVRAQTYNREAALKDMEQRRQQRAQAMADHEAQREALAAKRETQRCRTKECRAERRATTQERNEQRRAEIQERSRLRRECEQA